MGERLTLSELIGDLPGQGTVHWLGIRPAKDQVMLEPESIELCSESGIVGDRYAGRTGKRHVTLIQWEHLSVMASFLGLDALDPKLLRRNVCVGGINLLALKGRQFQLGDAVLEFTGLCHPCSAMQRTFGPGGYNAVRGHGGITAMVVQSGMVGIGDKVIAL